MGDIKDCCKEQDNLELQPQNRGDLLIHKCKSCGCRHFKMWAEQGVVGARLGLLGKKK